MPARGRRDLKVAIDRLFAYVVGVQLHGCRITQGQHRVGGKGDQLWAGLGWHGAVFQLFSTGFPIALLPDAPDRAPITGPAVKVDRAQIDTLVREDGVLGREEVEEPRSPLVLGHILVPDYPMHEPRVGMRDPLFGQFGGQFGEIAFHFGYQIGHGGDQAFAARHGRLAVDGKIVGQVQRGQHLAGMHHCPRVMEPLPHLYQG